MNVAVSRPTRHIPTGRVVFVGAVHEAEPALRALLDGGAEVAELSPSVRAWLPGRRGLSTWSRSRPHTCVVLRTENLNDQHEVERVRALRPDLIVAGLDTLLGDELPPSRRVPTHASMLPRDRGRAPVNWAIIRGETRTGNTMMFLLPAPTSGDIIDQRPVSIEPDDTRGTVYAKVGAVGRDASQNLLALLDGTARRRPQGPHLRPTCPSGRCQTWASPTGAARCAVYFTGSRAYLSLPGRVQLPRRPQAVPLALGVPGDEPDGEPGLLLGCEARRYGSA